VQLNPSGLAITTGLQLRRLWINKQTDWNPGTLKTTDLGGEIRTLATDIQATFCGDLFPSFRDKSDHVGLHPQGDGDHFIRCGHLKIQAGPHRLTKQIHVPVLNVATILAKVNRDSIGATKLGQKSHRHGIRFHGLSCLTHVGDVIDVDPEAGHGGRVQN